VSGNAKVIKAGRLSSVVSGEETAFKLIIPLMEVVAPQGVSLAEEVDDRFLMLRCDTSSGDWNNSHHPSSARLLLLRAPAGYSKTTCLLEWEAADKRPFAWISADSRHDDPPAGGLHREALDEIELVDPGPAGPVEPAPAIEAVVLPRLAQSLAKRTGFVRYRRPASDHLSGLTWVLRTVITTCPGQPSRLRLALRALAALGSLRAKRHSWSWAAELR
jgi:hypothetical protein